MRKTNFTHGHYAYTHSDPEGRVFYVGKGQGRRAHVLICRHAVHQKRINEIGRENVKITIYPAASEGQACSMEYMMIERYKTEGAPLCNQIGVVPPKSRFFVDLDAARIDKLKRLGLDWIAKQIDKAKEPPPQGEPQ